ncbi:MAG: hypothetical protein RBG1_1C00001G1361 [candidate division Zixibacteria bacterium RBG-1]|nr:MAG: hypothetical protein RBG1_1C00001G1361 [candidate division Zixibacteria bacterium RBG-1]OGC86130.1 MAG: hypothetical protein A2V73_04545 [candidate division Zixibacteria bacterium RBG_19FT_COMBO_42_43]
MENCIFCAAELAAGYNFCPRCGLSTLLALPYHPSIQRYERFLFLSLAGIVLGLLACILAYLQTATPVFVLFLILSLTASGLTFEATFNKADTLILKLLSLCGFFLSFLAFLLFLLLNSSGQGLGSYF